MIPNMLPNMKGKSSEERLIILQLPTLRYRRLRADMIEAYKILTGEHDEGISPKLKLRAAVTTVNPRHHSLALYQERSMLELRKNLFTQRIVPIWNSLPQHVIEANNMETFKSRLDAHWKNQSIKYDYKANLSGIRQKGVIHLRTEAS